jgi:HD-GYP domain-containing protein (c-di-GMP phosphodiesterase class II)
MPGDQPIRPKESDSSLGSAIQNVGEKLLREVDVVGSGVARSFKQAIENPGDQLKNLGISGAVGAGLALLRPESAILNLGKKIFVGSMLVHAIGDGGTKLATTGRVMADTWSSADNIERNKNLIAANLGQLTVDTTVSTLGGLGGAKLARTVHVGYDTYRMGRIADKAMAELELYHPESAIHSRRVMEMSVATGKQMGIKGLELQKLKYASMLHDLGKLDTPMEILGSHGRLLPTEYKVMQEHVSDSYRRITELGVPKRFKDIADIARQHHENIDGSGYPQQLTGDKIHPLSKIITVNDVHDALSSTRGYKPRLEIGNVRQIMADKVGVHFEPSVYNAHMNLDAGFVVKTMDFGVGRSTAQSLKLFTGKTWGETLSMLNKTTPTPSERAFQVAFDKIYTNHQSP